jgi:hypothetical protein
LILPPFSHHRLWHPPSRDARHTVVQVQPHSCMVMWWVWVNCPPSVNPGQQVTNGDGTGLKMAIDSRWFHMICDECYALSVLRW